MPWLIAIIFLLLYEAFALRYGRPLLSEMVFRANYRWPFLSTLAGFVTGSLLTHFFWHWCPEVPRLKSALILYPLSFILFFSGCSSLPADFFTRDKQFSLYGLYSVNPQSGLTGLGYLDYRNGAPVDAGKLKELEEQIATLNKAVAILLRNALGLDAPRESKPQAPELKSGGVF